MPYVRFTASLSAVNNQLKQSDIQLKQLANQQGGSITDPNSMNDTIAGLQSLYSTTDSPKMKQQIYKKLLDVQNQQMKLMKSAPQKDAIQAIQEWNNVKLDVKNNSAYLNSPDGSMQMIARLQTEGEAYYAQLLHDKYESNDFTKNSVLSGLQDELFAYSDILDAYSQNDANRLSGYGVFYKTDTSGKVMSSDVRRIDLSKDSNNIVNGATLGGLKIGVDSEPILQSDGSYANKIGNLVIKKTQLDTQGKISVNQPYDNPNVDFSSAVLPILKQSNFLPPLVKNEQSGQIYKQDNNDVYHPVDKQTFSAFPKKEQTSAFPMSDNFFQSSLVGNIGKDWNSYIKDQQDALNYTLNQFKTVNPFMKTGVQPKPQQQQQPSTTIKPQPQVNLPAIKKQSPEFTGGQYSSAKVVEKGKSIFRGIFK